MGEYGSEYGNEGFKEKNKENDETIGKSEDLTFSLEDRENRDNKLSTGESNESSNKDFKDFNLNEIDVDISDNYKDFDPSIDNFDESKEITFDPKVEDDELEEEVFDPNVEDDELEEEVFDPNVEDDELEEEVFDPIDKDDLEKVAFGPNYTAESLNEDPFNKENITEENHEHNGIAFNYPYLSDKAIQNTFREFYNETGKYPNYGRNLRRDFINWAKNLNKHPEIIHKIESIQDNQEITNFIKEKIKNTTFSQTDICDLLKRKKLSISRRTIGTISLKDVFKNNKLSHHQRFDISLEPKIKGDILKRIREEVEKYNSGVQHCSLYKIAREYPNINKTTIDKLARKEVPQELYKKIWPSTVGGISQERKTEIRNLIEIESQKENPRSLRNIAEDFHEISHTYAMELAKKMYPNRYKEIWPALKKFQMKLKVKL
ncbi:MAG: hypothetical protein ACXADU_10325 [Promethearchaeota archaeon]|jgi:hypothetical protein